MRNNKYALQYLLIPFMLIGLALRADLFLGNLSALTHNLKYYLALILCNTYLAVVYFKTIAKVSNNKLGSIAVFAIYLTSILPYFEHGSIISTIHVSFGYIGFTIFSLVIYKVINDFSLYSVDKSLMLKKIYILILFVVAILYMKYMAINGLMEMIYLIGMNMILWFIDININNC